MREDAASYVVEVNITKSIKDERVLAKADVAKIEREQLDLTAFEAIAKLTPVPDLLTEEEYAQRIKTVEKFLTDHRGSSKSKEAKAILAALKSEANEILAGGIKMNGKIVPPAEYRANAYDIDARIQEAKIRAAVKDMQYLRALRAFSEFDRDFRNTTTRAALVPFISQVMTTYMAEIGQSLATFDARVKEREVGLQRMPTADRRATETAIREETAELEKRFKAEKDAKLGWVTTHPFFKPSLEETIAFGKLELTRLSAAKSAAAVDGGKAFRDALSLIQGKGDKNTVTSAITAAKTAMVAPRYIAILESAAQASGVLK